MMSETDDLSWSLRWATWLRYHSTVKNGRAAWDRTFPAIVETIAPLHRQRRIASEFHSSHGLFTEANIAGMADEAEAAISSDGFVHNGKWNAPVGPAALDFVDRVGLAAMVSGLSGVEVEEPQGATYIAYLEAGSQLDFHVDDFHYGEVNMIICLRHTGGEAIGRPSSTVFIEPGGYRECLLQPADFVLFDGVFTPHGRTPVGEGEQVVLVSFSFRTTSRALRDVSDAPLAPAPPAP